MSYYIILFKDGSLKIYKNKQQVQKSARQFVCSSNVTVQDLFVWIANGFENLKTIQEVEK